MKLLPSDIRLPQGCEVCAVKVSERASVYRVHFEKEDYYLKIQKDGDMSREAEMCDFLHGQGMGPQTVRWSGVWLLYRGLPGDDLQKAVQDDPIKAAKRLGRATRRLHELDGSACPVKNPAQGMFQRARDAYLRGEADRKLLSELKCADADEAFREMTEKWERLRPMDDAVIHGDCDLSNLIWNGGEWGWVDAGYGGEGPRHYDLFWAMRSLRKSTGLETAVDAFRAAYGREDIDEELVRLFGLLSCFDACCGPDRPDPA